MLGCFFLFGGRFGEAVLRIEIKNFGKLADAVVRIGKFAVFAGPNSTGKSFVSKALYSIFHAMNANHLAAIFDPVLESLSAIAERMRNLGEIQNEKLTMLINAVEKLRVLIGGVSARGYMDEFSAVKNIFPEVIKSLGEIAAIFNRLEHSIKAHREADIPEDEPGSMSESAINYFELLGEDDLNDMRGKVDELIELSKQSVDKCIITGIHQKTERNLTGNFLTPKLSNIFLDADKQTVFRVGDICHVDFHGTSSGLSISPAGLHKMQQYSRVLYLDSPVFWRLRDGLRRHHPDFYRPRDGVPQYFFDMVDMIEGADDGESKFSSVLDDITAAIGGRVVVDDDTKGLIYRENGINNFPLSQTAMGIANFGMLGLLIQKNLLDGNTILFIDEPEAHLHPAWQVEMAKALFALAEGGVNVVIATHSADILKWIEAKTKKSPEAEKTINLNYFPKDGKVNGKDDNFADKLNAIQKDLTDPYYRLYVGKEI